MSNISLSILMFRKLKQVVKAKINTIETGNLIIIDELFIDYNPCLLFQLECFNINNVAELMLVSEYFFTFYDLQPYLFFCCTSVCICTYSFISYQLTINCYQLVYLLYLSFLN